MPIRDTDESEEPQADNDLLEYIDRRRDYQARQRRRRFLVAAVAALGVITLALAFSNVVLMRRLAARTESPPVAAAPTPAPSAEPAPAPEDSTSVASGPSTPPAEPAPPSATRPPTASTGMVVESTTPPAPGRSTTPSNAGATDGDSARRTARWLVQTHGRLEAENRVTKVADFYSGSEQGAFWRRVLVNVRQTPER
jgi:hypothetical protein